jgi:hypothetical protein
LAHRATEKFYRESESALTSDIRRKLAARPESDNNPVVAEPQLVKPFSDLFDRLFVWHPGKYVVELVVDVKPGSASFSKKYRFTLYESDSAELRSHINDYPFGGSLSYNIDRHVGALIPLSQHGG